MRVREAIRRVSQAASAHGATVENDSAGEWVTLQVCAPDGKVWRETGGEHIVITTARGPQSWLDEAVQDGIQRIAQGLEDA